MRSYAITQSPEKPSFHNLNSVLVQHGSFRNFIEPKSEKEEEVIHFFRSEILLNSPLITLSALLFLFLGLKFFKHCPYPHVTHLERLKKVSLYT